MERIAVALFDNLDDAQNAANAMHVAGVSSDQVSLITRDTEAARYALGVPEAAGPDRAERVAESAGGGAMIGGVLGMTLGAVSLAIPGVGAVLASGALVGALAGTGLGSIAGATVGTWSELGERPEEVLAERLREGGAVMAIGGEAASDEALGALLRELGAGRVERRWVQERGEVSGDDTDEAREAHPMARHRTERGQAAHAMGSAHERPSERKRARDAYIQRGYFESQVGV